MKRYFPVPCVVLFVFLISFAGHAQQNPIPQSYANPVQPDPNVATLGKFGDIPVSTYTGIPEISIPLMNVKIKDYEMPISVAYHASGIGVSEEASFVGLGWALNAGGVITQTINGWDDFDTYGYVYTLEQLNYPLPGIAASDDYSDANSYYALANVDCDDAPMYHSYLNYVVQPVITADIPIDCQNVHYGDRFIEQHRDFEPDMFYFNCGKYSGKFLWDRKNQRFETLERQNILIELEGVTQGWILTTPDGVKYYFEKLEIMEVHSNTPEVNGAGGNVTTSAGPNSRSYYLTKIKLTSGEEFLFSYSEGQRVCRLAMQSQKFPIWIGNESVTVPNARVGQTTSYSESSYLPQRLDTIRYPGGFIKFSWDTRIDIPGDKRLTRIEQFVDLDTSLPVNYAWFGNENYFEGHDTESTNKFDGTNTIFQCDPPTTDQLLKRLKLSTVTLKGQERPYTFLYNEGTSLPAKTSYAQDYWGYYNGNDHAKSFYPMPLKHYEAIDEQFLLMTTGNVPVMQINYQDRTPNDKAGTWLMSGITYPTSGYTNFSYQNNTYANYTSDNYSRQLLEADYIAWYSSTTNELPPAGSELFTLDKTQTVEVVVSLDASAINTDPLHQNAVAKIINNDNNQVVWYVKMMESTGSFNLNCQLGAQRFFPVLPTGNYRLLIERDDQNILCNSSGSTYSLKVFYLGSKDPFVKFITGPGMRVKSMVSNDAMGNQYTHRYEYEYTQGTGSQSVVNSYGLIMNTPVFFREYPNYWSCLGSVNSWSGQITVAEMSGHSFNGLSKSARGSFIGYSQVNEFIENGTSTEGVGRIEHHFVNQPDAWQLGNLGPCVSFLGNGDPSLTEYFDQEDHLLKRETYTYPPDISPIYLSGMIIQDATILGSGTSLDGTPVNCTLEHVLKLHFYPIIGGRHELGTKNTETFNLTSGTALAETESYTYYSNYLLQTVSVTESDGKTKVRTLKYPQHFSVAPYSDMATGNRIEPVIEEMIDENDQSTSTRTYHQLNNYSTANGTILLDNIQNSFGGADEQIFRVLQYDAHNNPVQVVDRSGVTKSYKYDATGLYPIAQVVNGNANQFFFTGFEDGNGDSQNSDSHSGRKSILSGVHIPIYSLVAPDTYTLSYWKKDSNGMWQYYESPFTVTSSTYLDLTGQIDDIRVFKTGALMKTYTYDYGIGMTSQTDENNVTTYYVYDVQGRLKDVLDYKRNLVKHFEYHYKK